MPSSVRDGFEEDDDDDVEEEEEEEEEEGEGNGAFTVCTLSTSAVQPRSVCCVIFRTISNKTSFAFPASMPMKFSIPTSDHGRREKRPTAIRKSQSRQRDEIDVKEGKKEGIL